MNFKRRSSHDSATDRIVVVEQQLLTSTGEHLTRVYTKHTASSDRSLLVGSPPAIPKGCYSNNPKKLGLVGISRLGTNERTNERKDERTNGTAPKHNVLSPTLSGGKGWQNLAAH